MKWNTLTTKEKLLWTVRGVCFWCSYPFHSVGNWATKKLNESYYQVEKE